jgi:hypothetical protein
VSRIQAFPRAGFPSRPPNRRRLQKIFFNAGKDSNRVGKNGGLWRTAVRPAASWPPATGPGALGSISPAAARTSILARLARRLLAPFLLFVVASHAVASLVSYEGFGYANGSALNGASGGSGFSANWIAESGVTVGGTSLTYPNLPAGSAGSAVVGAASYSGTYRTFANRAGTDT